MIGEIKTFIQKRIDVRRPVIGGSFRLTIGVIADMEAFMAAFANVIGRGE